MRTRLVPLVVVLVAAAACRHSDKYDSAATIRNARPTSARPRGPDPILLRIPRGGGTARAYLYPKLDSVVWVGDATPIERVLGFDPEGGTISIVDATGEPARLDLHLGESSVASQARLTSLTSVNGTDIYGIDGRGRVARLTRSGDWTFTPPSPARAVFPAANGELLVMASRAGETIVWRLHPPETRILDTTTLNLSLRGVRTQAGDRVYFGTDTALVSVKMRDLSVAPSVRLGGRVISVAPTPSGDRVYVAVAGERAISIVDRYTDKIAGQVELPGVAAELRMDPLGRYVIARPVHGDSAWVIAIATDRLVGSVETKWTADLPACAPDGAIAVNNGRDVVFVDGETLQTVRTVVGGAGDFWYFMFWNGFRPRATGLDQPVSFARKDSTDSAGTADSTGHDTATVARDSATHGVSGAAPGVAPPPPGPGGGGTPPSKVRSPGFIISFAALLSEQKAQEMAKGITVNGTQARVVPVQRAGTMVYRVVLGPYASRDAAEQVGRAAQRSFWVYPDEP